MKTSAPNSFAQDEALKAQKLEQVRQRLQAATPATKKPMYRHAPQNVRRSLMAALLLLILVGAMLLGSGLFV